MNFLAQIGQRLKKPVFSGYGGRGGSFGPGGELGWLRGYTTAGYDHRAEAGAVWESSVPHACLKWEQRACAEPEIMIQGRDANGDWRDLPRHPALRVLQEPNPFFEAHQLLDAVRFDYRVTGNGYLYKRRGGSGRVVELWWIPSWMIDPRWDEDGEAFINCYEYRVNGRSYALPVSEVIHFRNGIDPRWQGRKGLSDFAAVLREVCSDNEASVFLASMLRNMGVPGVIISPKPVPGGGLPPELNREQRRNFKEQWQESFTGSRRGEPFVQSIPVEVQMPGFSPQQLVLDKVRAIPEERISAAFGIPAVVLGLGSGLQNSNTRSSHADAREQAYQSCIIPVLTSLARTLTKEYLAEMYDPRELRVWFDYSEVRCLQDDETDLYNRLAVAVQAGFMTVEEARGRLGLKT